jgi:hypothetical protein
MGKPALLLAGKPVESLQVERPVEPLSFAGSLRERRDLVTRQPDRNTDHKRPGLKPWLSAVGVKPFISYFRGRILNKHHSNGDFTPFYASCPALPSSFLLTIWLPSF